MERRKSITSQYKSAANEREKKMEDRREERNDREVGGSAAIREGGLAELRRKKKRYPERERERTGGCVRSGERGEGASLWSSRCKGLAELSGNEITVLSLAFRCKTQVTRASPTTMLAARPPATRLSLFLCIFLFLSASSLWCNFHRLPFSLSDRWPLQWRSATFDVSANDRVIDEQ